MPARRCDAPLPPRRLAVEPQRPAPRMERIGATEDPAISCRTNTSGRRFGLAVESVVDWKILRLERQTRRLGLERQQRREVAIDIAIAHQALHDLPAHSPPPPPPLTLAPPRQPHPHHLA